MEPIVATIILVIAIVVGLYAARARRGQPGPYSERTESKAEFTVMGAPIDTTPAPPEPRRAAQPDEPPPD